VGAEEGSLQHIQVHALVFREARIGRQPKVDQHLQPRPHSEKQRQGPPATGQQQRCRLWKPASTGTGTLREAAAPSQLENLPRWTTQERHSTASKQNGPAKKEESARGSGGGNQRPLAAANFPPHMVQPRPGQIRYHLAVWSDQDVGRGEVPVDQPAVVQQGQAHPDALRYPLDLGVCTTTGATHTQDGSGTTHTDQPWPAAAFRAVSPRALFHVSFTELPAWRPPLVEPWVLAVAIAGGVRGCTLVGAVGGEEEVLHGAAWDVLQDQGVGGGVQRIQGGGQHPQLARFGQAARLLHMTAGSGGVKTRQARVGAGSD
jgi:hypothetical protein